MKQFWGFLNENPIIFGILEHLEKRCPEMKSNAEKIINNEALLFDEEIENVGTAYFILKMSVQSDDDHMEVKIGRIYSKATNYNEMLEPYKEIFLEPLYEYIDEHLDDQGALLALLKKYKHKCEWFQREHLFNQWEEDTQRGEKHLALHLYEYLHDQGLNFYIEPASISGEVDLISAQIGNERLVADVKIYNPDKSKGKPYLIAGFNQIYTYTWDYNEPFGYLIIFNTALENIQFALAEKSQSVPFLTHNNKTIFLLVIDIFPYEKSASKRGPLKSVQITEQELIKIIQES
ncbi:MAG: hypothetical protein IH886_11055 [Nitrospinae bacterium]|nr:hypothetical protein [Nitrospinota bacterium]